MPWRREFCEQYCAFAHAAFITTMATDKPHVCLLCASPLIEAEEMPPDKLGSVRLICGNCGDHRFDTAALKALLGHENAERARLAFGVRQLPAGTFVGAALLKSLAETVTVPGATERLDILVRILADSCRPGQRRDLNPGLLLAAFGATAYHEVRWVLNEAMHLRLIDGTRDNNTGGLNKAFLTIDGWTRHAELMRAGAGSRHAFMAMKFGDAQMDGIYADHMRLAVDQAGFELRTTAGDHKTAGSIDNRMRVEIRTSRFVVCDLTHGNRGAYWEAGFAEGLGRPVFYTCRQDVLSDKTHPDHPHFDTAHQLIVAWDPDDVAAGMQELKDVIRATLPAEARMEDPTNG